MPGERGELGFPGPVRPQVHLGHVVPADRGGVHQPGQGHRRLIGPEHHLAQHRGLPDQGGGPADRDLGGQAPGDDVRAERRGDPADAVRVEHVHRAQQGPGARGQLVQVRAGRERHARPAVGQHPLPEEPGLADPGRGDDRGLVLLRGEHPLEVLRPAQPPGVPGHRADQPRPESQVRADPPAVDHRGQPGPAERQLGERGEPRRGPQPEPDPPPRPPRRQRREQRGAHEHRHGEDQDHQDEEPHRCASSSRAASIASEIASAARIAAA